MDLVALVFSVLAFCGIASTHTALILWTIYGALFIVISWVNKN